MTLGTPEGSTGRETPDPEATRSTNPRLPTAGVPLPRPTRDPIIDPRGEEGGEASVGRVRGVAQLPTRPSNEGTPEDGTGGRVTPTPSDKDVISRGEVEPAGTEDNIRAMQEAVGDFLRDIEEDVKAGRIRVSLVSFDDRARTLAPLTDNPSKVRSQLLRIRGGGNTRLDLGLSAAQRELVGANVRGRTDLDHAKVIIAWSDGKVDPRTVARLRKRDNIKVFAVGVGQDANEASLRRIASEGEWVYKLSDRRDLVEDFRKLSPTQRQISIPAMDVTEQLAGSMELVPGSMNPPASMPDAKTMTWHLEPPTLPMTFTYRVRPLEAGTLPVSVLSKVTYTDSERRAFDRPFPELKLEVERSGLP
jgi:uncharacterized protein YegL